MALMIRKSIRIRNMLRKKAHNSCKDSDRFMYRKLKNKANNMNKYANSKYYENFDSSSSDAHLDNKNIYWKLLKYIVLTNSTTLN